MPYFGRVGEIEYAPKIVVALPEAMYASLTVDGGTGNITINRGFVFENIDLSLSTGDVDCYASAEDAIKIEISTGEIELEDISADLIKLKSTTGDIELSNVNVSEDVTIEVTTGDISLEGVRCRNLTTDGGSGNVELEDVIAVGTISVEATTGNVYLENSDASELYINATTGDIKGNLLTDKVFIAKATTGKVRVPSSEIGGKCKITTTTGDIIITVSNN